MAKEKSGGRIIPSRFNRERSIVIVVVIVAVAIILIVVAIGLYYASRPTNQNVPAGPTYQTPTAQNVTKVTANITLDSYTYSINESTGDTDIFVTVTNPEPTEQTRNVTATIIPVAGTPIPNQPYPSKEQHTNLVSVQNTTVATFAPGETRTVQVTVPTPPGLTFDASNIKIQLT